MQYTPETLGRFESFEDVQEFLLRALQQLEQAINEVSEVQLTELNAAPAYPQHGKLYFADGTNWNPGGGRGYYGYDSTGPTWRKLG